MPGVFVIISAARANCLLDNSDLLSITSYEEYNYVKSMLYPIRLKTYAFWIGLNSRDSKYIYSWSDGSALTTVQWLSGNPAASRYGPGIFLKCTHLLRIKHDFCSNFNPVKS